MHTGQWTHTVLVRTCKQILNHHFKCWACPISPQWIINSCYGNIWVTVSPGIHHTPRPSPTHSLSHTGHRMVDVLTASCNYRRRKRRRRGGEGGGGSEGGERGGGEVGGGGGGGGGEEGEEGRKVGNFPLQNKWHDSGHTHSITPKLQRSHFLSYANTSPRNVSTTSGAMYSADPTCDMA